MAKMTEKRQVPVMGWAVVVGSGVWAMLVLLISAATFSEVNPDARLLVGSAIVLAIAAAVAASWLASRGRFGWAAAALLASVVAPTYFLWVVNVLPLLLAAGAMVAADRKPLGSLMATVSGAA